MKDYFRLKYKKCDLEYVNIFKHLGIQLSYFLSDIPHFEYCKQKAINAIGALQTKVDLKKISLDTATKLFEAIIYHVAMYGIETSEQTAQTKYVDTY